jgi:DNA adenine methylase
MFNMTQNTLDFNEKQYPRTCKSIPSLIKWTGSKRSQAEKITSLFPRYDRYFEPFLGGGAVLFLAAHPRSVASDVYQPLVDLWRLVRDDPQTVIDTYTEQWKELNAELDSVDLSTMTRGNGIPLTYYKIRSAFNAEPNPLDLNFLLRTCVNGIVRFNDQGGFNNSFHLSRRGMNPSRFVKIVHAWHPVLHSVEINCSDYKEILDKARKGDVVYLDPPYAGTRQRYAGLLDPNELFAELDKLNQRDVSWLLSYDGKRGEKDLTYDVPKDIFKRRIYIHSGNSAVNKVLNGPVESVEEALYLNY